MLMSQKISQAIGMSAVVLALGAAPACSQGESQPQRQAAAVPADLQIGEQKFRANCSACHGVEGGGDHTGAAACSQDL